MGKITITVGKNTFNFDSKVFHTKEKCIEIMSDMILLSALDGLTNQPKKVENSLYKVISFDKDSVLLQKKERKETGKEKKERKSPLKNKFLNYLIRLPYYLFTRQRLNKDQS